MFSMFTDMNQICAIVDAQGFVIRGQFYARECAIVAEGYMNCQEFRPNINWYELSRQERNTIHFCTNKIHGLRFNASISGKNSPIPSSDEIVNYLKMHYMRLATKERSHFAVKNKLLKDILISANIPVIDLDDGIYNLPPVGVLERKYNVQWVCGYHRSSLPPPPPPPPPPPSSHHNGSLSSYHWKMGHRRPRRYHRCAYRKCLNIWRYLKENVEFFHDNEDDDVNERNRTNDNKRGVLGNIDDETTPMEWN